MKITHLIVILIAIQLTTSAQNKTAQFQILPQPQSVHIINQKGIHYSSLSYIVAKDTIHMPVLPDMLSILPQHTTDGKGIILEITEHDTPSHLEGYILEVSDKNVSIKARGEAGLFYACQTLQQLMEDSRDFDMAIPSMKITDYPSVQYRAIHLDTKHHLDRMQYYYNMVDKLARYKINAIIWEIEDKLRFTRRPEIAAPNAISKQEMQALCRYAKDRHIDISPLVQGLGHAAFILKHHPELRENPDSDWEFCPSEPKTYGLQFDLYADAIEAMPYGKYLHVGGDEITAIGIDDRCKARGKTAFELQMEWLKKVSDYAVQHGREPIFWDDMPLKYSKILSTILSQASESELDTIWNTDKLDKAIELFPKACIYMRWNYGDATLPAHQRILKWYKNKGLKVMGATAASSGNSPFLPRAEKPGYIKGFSKLIADNNLLGILSTAWDDGSPHLETVFRNYIAQGEFAWNTNGRTLEAFKKAHGQREFGFNAKDNKMQFVDTLEKAAFFFDDALVSSGRRNPAWGVGVFTLLDLPDKNNHGVWSQKYKGKIEAAKMTNQRCSKITKDLQRLKKEALRNRYTLKIYEQTNYLVQYPAKLLLALHAYDMAVSEKDREEAFQQIASAIAYFDTMRTRLEQVYSETRFMQNPQGYVLDMNKHRHLAAKTNNSDWIYLYELAMIDKIKDWLTRI